jgi:GH24 family phage-related lysozyme (muramidase)
LLLDPILRRDIQQAERLELLAYKDTKGFWTIGWGHKLPAGHDWNGCIWTQAQADKQFDDDILDAWNHAQKLPEWSALDTRARTNALVELVFNMGCKTWLEFVKTRPAIRRQDWKCVSDELKDSDWYKEVHATRGDRLRDYFLTGSYPPSVAASLLYVSSSSAWPHGFVPAATSLEDTGSQP